MESGKRLGHFELLAPLGAGGMGEVHQPRDTDLKRDVALKILPEEVSADPERLAAFARRIVAAPKTEIERQEREPAVKDANAH